MRRKLALISATVALGALLVVGGTMAYFTGTAQKTNTITTYGDGHGLYGDIKVEEDLPGEDEQKKIGYTAVENENGIAYSDVKPGMTIAKNPTVKYDGTTSAYIRYTIEVTGAEFKDLTFYKDGKVVSPMEAAEGKVVGSANGKKYVYYTDAKEKEFSDLLFDKVKFNGAAFGNDFSGAEIVVVADAVSAEDFEPNFKGEETIDPWGGVEIEADKQ